jgi:hypothetical protein
MPTLKVPLLLNQPTPSEVPRKKRVAPAGTTKVWTVPVPFPVLPSPMKNACFSAGERVVKLVLVKSRAEGAAEESGWLASRKTPTSALMGHVAPEMPLVDTVVKTEPPSGGSVGGAPVLSTLPVTENVREDPGVTEMLVTSTGDWAGAASPLQHVEPFGIPDR